MRILDSWGFRYGLALMTTALVVGAMLSWELLPEGPLESVASSFFLLTLSPGAALLWLAVGVLAPPAPFRAGLLLGLVGAAMLAVLLLVSEPGFTSVDPVAIFWMAIAMVVIASFTVGVVGWIVRRVFLPPEARRPFSQQVDLEPNARPWPPVAIALAYTSAPLVLLAPASMEWIGAAALAAIVTASMIVGGLDVQRRYPGRRTPVVLVGLVAGLVAGLAMLQAIWAERLWPERRRSSDLLAVGVSTMLVIGATYVAYGETFGSGASWIVEPMPGIEPGVVEVELAKGLLEDRLSALDVQARVTATTDGRITVEVPTDADEGLVSRVLGSIGLLEFTPVPARCAAEVVQDAPQPACLDATEPLFDGSEVDVARIGQDRQTGQIVVNLELKEAGARLFDEYAEDHLYEQFAIVLDGIVQSAPSINATHFGGQAQISGDFTVDEASVLVAALQAGQSLPYPVLVWLDS